MTQPLRGALRQFYALDGFFLAAGLSFYVIVCVWPLLLLVVAAGGFLLSNEMLLEQVLEQLGRAFPVYQAEIERLVTGLVEARGVSSLVGTASLLFFGSQLFSATRLVLNRVLGTGGRTLLRGLAFDLGMMLILTLLLFLTVGITGTLAWAKRTFTVFGDNALRATLFEWAGLVLALGANTLLFFVLYRFIPLRRFFWRGVLWGSLTTAVLWELAKQLFRWYIESLGVYSAVYGSLGATIALIMWVYYSAVVFVFGAALIRALEEGRHDRMEARASFDVPREVHL